MSPYCARYTEDRRNCQILAEHLSGVAVRCAQFASQALPGDARFAEIAHATGLLHDLGKYRDEFRQYLMVGTGQRSAETAHAMYGAAAACFEFNLEFAAFAIGGHHAGLHNFFDGGANPIRSSLSMSFTHFARASSSLLGASRPPPIAGLGAARHKAL